MSLLGGLHELVERFDRERAAYRSGSYSQARVRVDFVNPPFAPLGWDIENRQGRPRAQRIVYEDRVKVGARPDGGADVSVARKAR